MTNARLFAGGAGVAIAAATVLLAILLGAFRASALSGADFLALDTTPAANTPQARGPIDNCIEVAPGGITDIDVVIDAVPVFDSGAGTGGLAGFGMNVLFDQTKISVTARATPLSNTNSMLAVNASSSITSFSNPVPQTDGNMKIVELDADSAYESGVGKIYSFQVTVAGAAPPGPTVLDLTDLATAGTGNEAGGDGDMIPDLYNSDTSLYTIGNIGDATIMIGQPCATPPPTSPPVTPTPPITPSPTPPITPSPTPPPSPSPSPSTTPPTTPSPTPPITPSPTPPITPSPTPPITPSPTPPITPSPTPPITPSPTPVPPTPTPFPGTPTPPPPTGIPPECAGMTFDTVLTGTSSNDTIIGTQGRDLIFGLGGNDYLSGQNGDDCLVGGDGDDTLKGEGGNDKHVAGNGDDFAAGGFGDDAIYGGAGNDHMRGEAGTDSCDGGPGAGDAAFTCEVVANVP